MRQGPLIDWIAVRTPRSRPIRIWGEPILVGKGAGRPGWSASLPPTGRSGGAVASQAHASCICITPNATTRPPFPTGICPLVDSFSQDSSRGKIASSLESGMRRGVRWPLRRPRQRKHCCTSGACWQARKADMISNTCDHIGRRCTGIAPLQFKRYQQPPPSVCQSSGQIADTFVGASQIAELALQTSRRRSSAKGRTPLADPPGALEKTVAASNANGSALDLSHISRGVPYQGPAVSIQFCCAMYCT